MIMSDVFTIVFLILGFWLALPALCLVLRAYWPNTAESAQSQIDKRPWLVFHGYKPDDDRRNADHRFVWRVPLRIAISDKKPMRDWIRPVL